ncbi:HlyD family secretion protein [Legionella nautarum]|uniref:HlyD family secretion protein n=1 Tax=Legionella nautarum TaxID=45070 RepID=UPI00138F0E84|nr:HlyD family efflux transporter periplasmic adaptor subunit [Legionella nautarum]
MLIFFYFAQISEKIFIRGYLDTEGGIISVESESPGLVDKVAVEEGSFVQKGQLLFVISNPGNESSTGQQDNLRERINNLKREFQIKDEHHHALLNLYSKNYISLSNLKDSESDLLELKNRLKEAEYQLIKYKENQIQHIRAPIDGTVTNIFYRRGQRIQSSKTLLQVIPPEVNLIARLYIPSRNAGFLKPEQTIYLKYDAYPPQRFGFYKAVIKEINQTILTDDKEDKPIQVGEPYYKIKAALKKSSVLVYGKKVKLNHGMTLTAIIAGEKKNIWQWILDPIYSYYGDPIV